MKTRKETLSDVAEKSSPPNLTDLADSIVRIDDAVKAMENSGLRRRAIVVLIQDHSGVARKNIEAVLDSLSALKIAYTK